MGFAEVSTMLWRERDALYLLLFKLVSEQLIVSSGRTRWLAQANEEIEFALEQLRGTEVLRAAETDALAEQLGLPVPVTLAQLADASEEPWATLYADHRQALLALMAEIEQVTAENRRLLTAGARADGLPVEAGYTHGFAVLAGCSAVAALVALLVPVPRRPEPEQREDEVRHPELAVVASGTLVSDAR